MSTFNKITSKPKLVSPRLSQDDWITTTGLHCQTARTCQHDYFTTTAPAH